MVFPGQRRPSRAGRLDGINRSQGHHSLNSFVVKLFQFGVQPFLEGKGLTFLSCFCFVLLPIHFPYCAFPFKGSAPVPDKGALCCGLEMLAASASALKEIFSIKLLRCVFNVVLSEKSILLQTGLQLSSIRAGN